MAGTRQTWIRQVAATRAVPQLLAHADNRHRRPLRDSLVAGCTALEVDVRVVLGRVFVGHTVPNPLRTLRHTYLQPLATLVRENGCVFSDFADPITLLLDVKSDGPTSRPVIERELARFGSLVTNWRDGQAVPGAVTVILSGTLSGSWYAAPIRWTGVDGRLRLSAGDVPGELMPLRSDCWPELFDWRGAGPMPDDERAVLQQLVDRAHASGQRVRFWDTPDRPGPSRDAVWSALLDAGVDYLGTDDLTGAQAFLRLPPRGAQIRRAEQKADPDTPR